MTSLESLLAELRDDMRALKEANRAMVTVLHGLLDEVRVKRDLTLPELEASLSDHYYTLEGGETGYTRFSDLADVSDPAARATGTAATASDATPGIAPSRSSDALADETAPRPVSGGEARKGKRAPRGPRMPKMPGSPR